MERVIEIIKQLETTSGTNDKIAIIKNNKDNELFKQVLQYTYLDKNYGFSEVKLRQLVDDEIIYKGISRWSNVFEMLDELASSNINVGLRG